MKNELLTIGPFTIYGYGAMIAIGILVAYFVCEYRAEKAGLEKEEVFPLACVSVLGGFAGAKTLFWITEWRSLIENPGLFLKLTDGFVVYGGIIGGIFAGYLYTKRKKLYFPSYFDMVMPSVALAQGFGRIGCLLAGCCYGKVTTSACNIMFHESDYAPNNVPLLPTQIYSSILDFCLFFLLVWLEKRKKAEGQVAALYLICYSAGRFIMEFFRGDLERGQVGVLSTSQFIAVFTFLLGGVLWIYLQKTETKKRKYA